MPIVCVDIIIKNNDGEFLLVKRNEEPVKSKWWFVGGRVLKNESLVAAARRKVLEETGLEIESLAKIMGSCELFFDGDPFGHMNGTHVITTCFSANLLKDNYEVVLDSFHAEYRFFKVIDMKWNEYLVNCLKEAGFSQN